MLPALKGLAPRSKRQRGLRVTWLKGSGTHIEVQRLVEAGVKGVHVGPQVEGGIVKGHQQVGVDASPADRVPVAVIEA